MNEQMNRGWKGGTDAMTCRMLGEVCDQGQRKLLKEVMIVLSLKYGENAFLEGGIARATVL
jgi:hypothetical protein